VLRRALIAASLVAVALSSGGFVAVSSASGGSPKSVQSATEGLTENSEFPATGRELFFKMMLSVLLVIVLGVAAIYICRKLLPGITNPLKGQIRILETVHLGRNCAVHLIGIGNQQLLIGSTNEGITMLAELDTRCSILDTRQESSIENQESRM